MPGLQLDAGTGAILVASVATLVLAGLVLVVDFGNRVHRAFALFLVLRALLDGSYVFTPTADDLAGRLRGYLFIALPFAAFYFGYAYRRRYLGTARSRASPARWLVPLALLLAALAFEMAYVGDHSYLASRGQSGPLIAFLFLPTLAPAAIALLFAHDFRTEASPQHGRALAWASIGLALSPLFYSTFRVVDFGLDRALGNPSGSGTYYTVEMAAMFASLALVGLAGYHLLRRAAQLRQRGMAVRIAVLSALAVASSLAVAAAFAKAGTGSQGSAVQLLGVLRAVWLLGLPVLVTYALVRYHLFDADVKLRFAIKGTTLAAIFVGAFFVVSETAQEFFSSQASSPYFGILGASLLVFAMTPLQHFADRLARAAVPADPPVSQLSHPERLRLYREQLELAWADGTLTRKERMLFDRLRERLGLSAREAAVVESEIVGTGPLPGRKPVAA